MREERLGRTVREARRLGGAAFCASYQGGHEGPSDLSNPIGQATLEAALALPVVLLSLLLIVQTGIVVRDALALQQAAREGARAVAITGQDDDARSAVRRAAGPLDAERIGIDVSPDERQRHTPIDVRLSYVEELRIPIVSRILSLHLPLRAYASMRLERAP